LRIPIFEIRNAAIVRIPDTAGGGIEDALVVDRASIDPFRAVGNVKVAAVGSGDNHVEVVRDILDRKQLTYFSVSLISTNIESSYALQPYL
jgi:hypothetical protein